MKLTNKKFPHPVLFDGNKDYLNSKFYAELDACIEGGEYSFQIEAFLDDKILKKLIADGKAAYFVHIESNKTRFRNFKYFKNNEFSLKYPWENFGNKAEILIGITALEDILDYSNDNLSSDFSGIEISLSKNDILALDYEMTVEIDKEDLNSNTGNIFVICPNDDIEVPAYDIQEDEDKITILLPRKLFKTYAEVQADPDSHNILNTMFIIPVLSEALRILKSENEKYDECEWAKVLHKKLEKLNLNLESIEDYYEAANKILHTITEASLDNLKTILESKGEENG